MVKISHKTIDKYEKQSPSPVDRFECLIKNYLDRKTNGSSSHKPLSLKDQEINRSLIIRIAGYDDEGNELDEDAIERDAKIIDVLHAPQVLRPEKLEEQMGQFRKKILACTKGIVDIDPKEFEFMQQGGHVPSVHLPQLLPDIVRGTHERTYALLVEYKATEKGKDFRVPLAYHFGFTELPNDHRFPNFCPSDIPGKTGHFAEAHHAEIWTPWRVGVLRKLTEDYAIKMEKLGIVIPDHLLNITATRRGINNSFKPVFAQAAIDLQKQYILYNTAVLQLPQIDRPSIEIPNVPLLGSNEGMFHYHGKRQNVEEIKNSNEQTVALAEWSVFGNYPESVLKAVFRDEGVLKYKGGFEEKDRLLQVGHILAEVVKRREKIRSIV